MYLCIYVSMYLCVYVGLMAICGACSLGFSGTYIHTYIVHSTYIHTYIHTCIHKGCLLSLPPIVNPYLTFVENTFWGYF